MNILVFLIYPLAAFLSSLKNIKSKEFRIVFVLMALFLGLLINTEGHSADISRYLEATDLYSKVSWKSIFIERDYFIPLLAKIVSLISNSPQVFAVILYIIYAILYLKCLTIIIIFFNTHTQKSWIYLLGVLLIIPFSYFNALRFALATWFFLWGILKVNINNKWSGYIVILVAPLVHYSYWIMIPLPILHYFFKDNLKYTLLIFVVSIFFMNKTTSYYIDNIASSYFSESTSNTVSLYASEKGLEYMNERYKTSLKDGNINKKIMTTIGDVKNYTLMYVIFLLCLFNYKKIHSSYDIQKQFTLLLLAFSLANLASSVSNGERFYQLTSALTIFILFNIVYSTPKLNVKETYLTIGRFNTINILFLISILYGLTHIYMSRYIYDFSHLFLGNVVSIIISKFII